MDCPYSARSPLGKKASEGWQWVRNQEGGAGDREALPYTRDAGGGCEVVLAHKGRGDR